MDIPKAEKFYRKIIEIEPAYAPAHSGLAKCYLYYAAIQSMPTQEAFDKAKEYALSALAIDGNLIDGHIAYLGCTFWQNWNLPEALQHMTKTIQKIPGSAEIHAGHSMLLLISERFDEALASMKLAIQLDPFSPHVRHRAGIMYYCMGLHTEAIEEFNQEVNIAGRNDTEFKVAWCYIFLGQYNKALKILDATTEHPHQIISHDVAKGYLYAQAGDATQAKFWLDKSLEKIKNKEMHFPEYNATVIYMLLKDQEKLWHYLEATLEARTPVALFTQVDPLWNPIKEKQPFKDLINKYLYSSLTRIKTNTQEDFTIDLRRVLYIEAEDNYCHMVYQNSKEAVLKKLLRLPLKDLEKQLDKEAFVRTHRSFIINIKRNWQLLGKSKNYQFKIDLIAAEVPLSRSKEKEVLEKFRTRVIL